MNGNNSIWYELNVDNSRLREGLSEAQKLWQNSENTALKTGMLIVKVWDHALQNADGFTDSIRIQREAIKELESELRNTQNAAEKLAPETSKASLITEINQLGHDLRAEKEALEDIEAAYVQHKETQMAVRTEMRLLREEMERLKLAGQKESERYGELSHRLTELGVASRIVQVEQKALCSGSNQLAGAIQGLQGLMGAYTAGSGIIGMFTKDQEKLGEVQAKTQSIMTTLIGLQQAVNTLHGTSAFRTKTLAEVTKLWAAAQHKVTAALGGSAVAANILMGTLTLGLSVAIGAIISGLNKWSAKQQEARETTAQFNRIAAETAAESIAGFSKMRSQWESLGDSLEAKQRFIANNKNEFAKLGVEVNGVADAENILVNNSGSFVEALKARAKAIAAFQSATELYRNAFLKEIEAGQMPDTKEYTWANGQYGGVTSRQVHDPAKSRTLAEAQNLKTMADGWINQHLSFSQKEQDILSLIGANYAPIVEGSIASLEIGLSELRKKYNEATTDDARKRFLSQIKAQEAQLRRIDPTRSMQTTSAKDPDPDKLNQQITKAEQSREDLRIAQIEDKGERVREQIRIEYERQIAEVAKQEQAWLSAQKGELTTQQKEWVRESTELAEDNKAYSLAQLEKESLEAQAESMRSYLKEYGTLQQQKLAIAEEYAEQIREAESTGNTFEVKRLEKRMQAETAAIEIKSMKADIDWGVVFGEFGNMLEDQFRPLLDNLREYANSEEFMGADPQDQQIVYDAINQLEKQFSGGLNKSMFADIANATQTYKESISQLIAAKETEKNAVKELTEAQKNLQEAQNSGDEEQITAAQEAVTAAQEAFSQASESVAQYTNASNQAAEDLRSSSLRATNSLSNLESGLSKLSSGSLKGAAEGLSDIGKEMGGKLGNALQGLGGGLISSVLGILDILKNGIGTLISDLIDTVLGAVTGILDNILSGKIFKQNGMSLFNGVKNIFHTVTFGLFKSSGNSKQVTDTINRLTGRNERLQAAIEDLTSEMKNSKGAKSVKAYEDAKKYQEEVNKNNLGMVKAQASYNKKYHSWNYYWGKKNGFDNTQMAWIRENVKEDFNGDPFTLSPEEMKKLRSNVGIWEYMRNTGKGGYGDKLISQLDNYIDQAGKLDELTNSLHEALTGMSFDSLYSSFVDALMDMDATAEDFADNISGYFMRAMLANKIGELYAEELEDWWHKFGKAMEDGTLTEKDRADLRNEYMRYVDEALKIRDELASVTGYDELNKSKDQREASSKGFASMSQDSADELNGRFTAVQGHTYGLLQNSNSILESVKSIQEQWVFLQSHNAQVLDHLSGIHQNTTRLEAIETGIKSACVSLNNIELKGVILQK